MAHIASCMTGLDSSNSSKPCSPVPPSHSETPPPPPDKPYTWRMQPEAQRKYQLFPKGRQSPSPSSNTTPVDPETAFALAMNQGNEKMDKNTTVSGLKIRISPQNLRRRKISVTDLGPMTTVQEVSMDSPTIPGRPPLRERSSSAPQDGPKQDQVARPPMTLQTLRNVVYAPSITVEAERRPTGATPTVTARGPSPKRLAPLVIPEASSEKPLPELRRTPPFAHLRSDSTPPLGTAKSSRLASSPLRPRLTPTASTPELMSCPVSATTDTLSVSTVPTPVSAPLMENKLAPKQWDSYYRLPLSATKADENSHGHRRFASESGSIMDRGRPRRRNESRNTDSPQPSVVETKRSKSAERRAFEELPKGWKPREARKHMNTDDIVSIRKQAFGQAQRFEVLQAEDVEALSKELRKLDERTEYLRRTYNSLRTGRRNLHSRICQYLRSPRVAKFSHESMLKQEEALAELESSIDDWVIKLERAENRRTRVRQKLLEHIAGAAILSTNDEEPLAPPQLPRPQDISTPPRSPTKPSFTSRAGSTSPSPQRVVAQVPSTVLELPSVEEVDEDMLSRKSTLKRSDCESIRIYAGDELFALLTDVEDEINKMSLDVSEREPLELPQVDSAVLEPSNSLGQATGRPESAILTVPKLNTTPQKPNITNTALNKHTSTVPSPLDLNVAVPVSPAAPTPPMKDFPEEAAIYLTSAVFIPN